MKHTKIESTENGFIVKMFENDEIIEMKLVQNREDAIKFSEQYIRENIQTKVLLKESV
jgi:hypothetical protein